MEKKEKKIDVRIIRMARWNIPKTKDVFSEGASGDYLAIGYFDVISFVSENDGEYEDQHPLYKAYQLSNKNKRQINKFNQLQDYTVQELMLFVNIGKNGFSETQVADFWEKDDLLIYVSLIHIDNDSDIDAILKAIDVVCKQKKISYLYYFSFDYSGIVLLVKGISFQEFKTIIFELNYGNTKNERKIKLFRDSYSVYGFCRKSVKKYYEMFAKNKFENLLQDQYNEEFEVTINIGIQNYNTYVHFYNSIMEKTAYFYSGDVPDVKEFALFGRHDVSIVNTRANMMWLLYVHFLLNRYTSTKDLKEDWQVEFDNSEEVNDCDFENKVFSTYESFIKIQMNQPEEFEDETCLCKNKFYYSILEKLNTLVEQYEAALKKSELMEKGEFLIPIYEVKRSILSILKNGLAEDFVLSMYDSFYGFVEYFCNAMNNVDQRKVNFEKLSRCFSEYIKGLNSLVNCAMHSERQFIQATAFNAIIYDVPAKIMAFYAAMIHEFVEVMKGEKDRKYSFLLVPDFEDEISLKIISDKYDQPPCDRILLVSINEKFLYNPQAVIRRLSHEVAHFVGDELRNREYRKKCVQRDIIIFSLFHFMHEDLIFEKTTNCIRNEFYGLVERILDNLPKNAYFSEEKYYYLQDLKTQTAGILRELKNNITLKKIIMDYIEEGLSNENNLSEEWKEYVEKLAEDNITLDYEWFDDGKLTTVKKKALGKLIWYDIFKEIIFELKGNVVSDNISRRGSISKIRKRQKINEMSARKIESKMIQAVVQSEKKIKVSIAYMLEIYSETFADLQMVLITGITYVQYLEGFVNDEAMDVAALIWHQDDLTRIMLVSLVFGNAGIWSIPDKMQESEKNQALGHLHEMLLDKMQKFQTCLNSRSKKKLENMQKNDMREAMYITGIYEYLLKCLKDSLDHYQKEGDDIEKLQKNIQAVLKNDDIKSVFMAMCNVLKEYKKKIEDR